MNVVDPVIIRESVDPPRAEFEIKVVDELFYLQGHFPEQAVLPGVVQIHWAIKLAKLRLGLVSSFIGIDGLKFHRIIQPQTPLKLTIEQSDDCGKLSFSYLSDLGMHSQGRVLFE
jgi:3-hydroxymyristoyl/3-hydroxydecanoyl-(acyl carrier protein) dehydratase